MRRLVIAATLALTGPLLASCGGNPPVAMPAAPPPTGYTPAQGAFKRDAHETLNGYLWVQTSAEYRALTSSLYRGAQASLERALADRSWTALPDQTTGYQQLPPAVIMDLDETVLDNSKAQGQFILDGTPYVSATWQAWVDAAAAPALPGARDFIAFAAARNVRVFYVTNRTLAEQAKTIDNLNAVGITATDENVMVVGEHGWTSDKTARRARVASTHRVVLLVGDDMNDFVATGTLTPQQRRDLADSHADRWGTSWILLPNPQYGTWERALTPGLSDDRAIRERKRQLVEGFR